METEIGGKLNIFVGSCFKGLGNKTEAGKTEITSAYTAGIGTTAYELDLFCRVRSLPNFRVDTHLMHSDCQKLWRTPLVL